MSEPPGASGVWVVDTQWRVPSAYEKCRTSPHHPCPNKPVADLNRKARPRRGGPRVDRWWAYCSEHLYGRRVNGDVVEVEVAAGSPIAERGWL